MSAALHVCLLGFGEVGTTLARDLRTAGHQVTFFDILLDDDTAGDGMLERAAALDATACRSPAEAAAGADLVVSAVTAAASHDVAAVAGDYLAGGQLFLDLNSVSPNRKRANASLVESGGARYVEAAAMAPIEPYGIALPLLVGGPHAAAFAPMAADLGMQVEIVSDEIGHASATKMCRSVMIKGLEALAAESLIAARAYGVEDRVLASLDETLPGIGFDGLTGYLLERSLVHGRRRAVEMREVAETIAEADVEPLLSLAIAARQDAMADASEADPSLLDIAMSEWRRQADLILGLGDG